LSGIKHLPDFQHFTSGKESVSGCFLCGDRIKDIIAGVLVSFRQPLIRVPFGGHTNLPMAYYDTIAKRWHETTGYKGGAFKELVLNSILLEKLSGIDNRSILELGAGNGYFLPLVLRRFPGQAPSEIFVTDQSRQLLEIARHHFRIPVAAYQYLDVTKPFPFADEKFDLILASMIFNEVPATGFKKALAECHRVLSRDGLFLIAVTHPDFISGLQKRGLLKTTREEKLTMPGSGSLRLPVVIRSLGNYRKGLQEAGFQYKEEECCPTPEVITLQAGLRKAWKIPVALVYTCTKSA
jgi:SAM-dependent methyltransferase